MAGLVGDLLIRIAGDNKEFDKAVQDSGKKAETLQNKFKKIGDEMAKMGKSLTKFVTLPILGIGTAAVMAASHAEEARDKFDVVFADQADAVREWAKEFADSVGRSRFETEEFLANVQDLFVPLGAARGEASELSKAVVTLATDIGSFNDQPTEEVIRNITSALVGNHETVRRYGVVIDEATLKTMGITTESTALEKALARLTLITQGTTDAQGNAVATADSFANTFVRLKTSIKDLSIEFGQILLPFIQKVIDAINGAVTQLKNMDTGTKEVVIRIALFAAAVGPLLIMLPKLMAIIAGLKTVMLAASGPIGLVSIAIAGLVAGLTLLVRRIRETRDEQALFNMVAEDGADTLQDYDDALATGIKQRANLRDMIKEAVAEEDQAYEGQRQEQLDWLANDPETKRIKKELEALQDKINAIVYNRDVFIAAKKKESEALQKELDAQIRAQLAKSAEEQAIIEAQLKAELEAELAAEAAKQKAAEETRIKEEEELAKRFVFEGEYYQWSNEKIDEWTESHRSAFKDIVAEAKDTRTELQKYWDEWGSTIKSTTSDFLNFSQSAFNQYFKNVTDGLDDQSKAFKEAMRKQAIVNKVFAIFNSTISGIEAVNRALASSPPPLNMILAIAVGAAAAAQTALIAAMPIPKAAKGGRFNSPYIGGEAGPEYAIPDQAPYLNSLAAKIESAMGNASINNENMVHVTVNLGSEMLYDDIRKATNDGRLLINTRALV